MVDVAIHTADGVALHADLHPAAGDPWATALVLHGMMVDRRSMDRPAGHGLASHLASRGMDVLNADFRGHGRSGQHGPWSYDEYVYLDLPALVAKARERGKPVWIVGLSLGGHTSLAAMGEGVIRVDGAVCLSCNIWRPSYEPSPVRRLRKGANAGLMRALTHAVGRFPSRRLRMGPCDEALPYVDDLTRFWRTDAWTSREGVDWARGLRNIDVPVLVVAGRGDDLLGHHEGARRWVAPVPGHVFAHVGRGDLGLEHDPDHIGLGADPRCRPVWDWVADWMASRG